MSLMPMGIITESDGDNGQFIYARESDYGCIDPDIPVVIWNIAINGASSKLLGVITEAGETSASFMITNKEMSPSWPEGVDPKGVGNPVYAGLEQHPDEPPNYTPDYSWGWATPEEYERLVELAYLVEKDTGVLVARGAFIPTGDENVRHRIGHINPRPHD